MNLKRILRHPRAAVIAHDLLMVAIAWFGAGWLILQSGSLGMLSAMSLWAEFSLIIAIQGLVL